MYMYIYIIQIFAPSVGRRSPCKAPSEVVGLVKNGESGSPFDIVSPMDPHTLWQGSWRHFHVGTWRRGSLELYIAHQAAYGTARSCNQLQWCNSRSQWSPGFSTRPEEGQPEHQTQPLDERLSKVVVTHQYINIHHTTWHWHQQATCCPHAKVA